MGNLAKWAATGEGTPFEGIEGWRGYAAKYSPVAVVGSSVRTRIWTPEPGDVSVLMSIHPANLFERPVLKTPTRSDWAKVPKLLRGAWPKPLPMIQRVPPPGFWRSGVAFDTEFHRDTKRLHRYSAFDGETLVVVEADDHDALLVPPEACAFIYQNTMADWLHAVDLGFTLDPTDVRDTMLAHAVLWPGFPHDLGFLGSLYSSLNRWKDLSGRSLREYAGGDAVGTWESWRTLTQEFARDPQSKVVYDTYVRRLPLILLKRRPLRVNQARVASVRAELGVRLAEMRLRAQAEVGWPINLGSADQIRHWLFAVEQIHRATR